VSDDELERMWKETTVVCFVVLPQNLPGGTKENYKKNRRICSPGWKQETAEKAAAATIIIIMSTMHILQECRISHSCCLMLSTTFYFLHCALDKFPYLL
jgi:hypothetical protein